jgi:hypothetical protein
MPQRKFVSDVKIENGRPRLVFLETDAATDEGRTIFESSGGDFTMSVQSDSTTFTFPFLTMTRSGYLPSTLEFDATTSIALDSSVINLNAPTLNASEIGAGGAASYFLSWTTGTGKIQTRTAAQLLSDIGAQASLTLGADTQIPVMNGTTDFDYTSNFTFDGTSFKISTIGYDLTHSPSGLDVLTSTTDYIRINDSSINITVPNATGTLALQEWVTAQGYQTAGDYLTANLADYKTTGNLNFNDDIRLTFGVANGSGDFQIYHDSVTPENTINLLNSDLVIRDNGSIRFTFGKTSGDFTAKGTSHVLGTASTANTTLTLYTSTANSTTLTAAGTYTTLNAGTGDLTIKGGRLYFTDDAGTEMGRFDSGGQFCVGETVPTEKVHIKGKTTEDPYLFVQHHASSAGHAGIKLGGSGSGGRYSTITAGDGGYTNGSALHFEGQDGGLVSMTYGVSVAAIIAHGAHGIDLTHTAALTGLTIERTGASASKYTLSNTGYMEHEYNASGYIWSVSGVDSMRLIAAGGMDLYGASPQIQFRNAASAAYGRVKGTSGGVAIYSADQSEQALFYNNVNYFQGTTTFRNTTNDEKARFHNGGGLSILNTETTYTLNVTGTGGFSSTVRATNFLLSSDERLKTDIKDVEVKPINTKWKEFELKEDKGQKRYGVIAQELEKEHPEFVRTDDEGMKSVAYIDLLVAKNAELEARLEKLETLINKLI